MINQLVRPGITASLLAALSMLGITSCGGGGTGGGPQPPPQPPPTNANARFQHMSATNLPVSSLNGMCMDADHGDVDGDGDIDLALAQENATNLVLLNDGAGIFSVSVGAVIGGDGDNEDVRLRDLGGNTSLDMLTVHEDDGDHALLINDGSGIFTDMPALIPINSTANAVEVIDLNNDTWLDILIGNQGRNIVLLQQADGSFVDTTGAHPIGDGTTQDLLLLDIDDDTDQDLFVVNEGRNRLFVNGGNGVFTDETTLRLPNLSAESREADSADIDNDGDLDIAVGNVVFLLNQPAENNLFVNDGTGNFINATSTQLANVTNDSSSFTIRFADVDADGDPDILSPTNNLNSGGHINVWLNDGSGNFSTAVESPFSVEPTGSAFDIEVVDLNADGKDDVYFCYRSGTDQLYIQQ